MADADHRPAAGCGFNRCGVKGDEANCPFRREEKPHLRERASEQISLNECTHEWRQYFANFAHGDFRSADATTEVLVAGWYCIHCRIVEKN